VSGLTQAIDVRFAPVAQTADRYLKLIIRPGDQPLRVDWSEDRPPGNLPLLVEGDPAVPSGGLVSNVGHSTDLPLGKLVRQSTDGASRAVRGDPAFFALYGLAVVAVSGWLGWSLVRRRAHGR
jgi:hypothetical protein